MISRSGAGACNHRLLAGPAGIFGTVRHDHPELRRDHVEPLRGLLADHMHGRAAAGAVGVVGLDRHIARAADGAGSAPRLARRFSARARAATWVLLVVGGLVAGNGLLDVLERQKQLLGIELLRTPAELRTLQLAQQMPQAIDLRQRLVALGDRGVTLRTRRREQRMQRFDIGRKLIGAISLTRDTESDSRAVVITTMRSLIQLVAALTMSPSAAQRHGHAAATSPSRRRARRAAMRSVASRRR